jgi:hypothetical protein
MHTASLHSLYTERKPTISIIEFLSASLMHSKSSSSTSFILKLSTSSTISQGQSLLNLSTHLCSLPIPASDQVVPCPASHIHPHVFLLLSLPLTPTTFISLVSCNHSYFTLSQLLFLSFVAYRCFNKRKIK